MKTFKSFITAAVFTLAITFATSLVIGVSFPNVAAAQTIQAPIANAGANVTAPEGTLALLNGSGSSDPQGFALTYIWTQVSGPTATLFNATTANLSVLVPSVGGVGGVMTFQLTVTDTAGLSASATVSVLIPVVDVPPVAVVTAPGVVPTGSTVTLDASSSYDPNGFPLVYSWIQLSGPTVSLDLSNQVKPVFVAPDSDSTLMFQINVSDGLYTSTATVSVQVVPAHHAPVASAGPNQTVGYGQTVTLDGTASTDPDGNPLTYAWTQASGPPVTLDLTNPAKPTFMAPSTTGALSFSLVVSDAYLSSTASTVSISVFPEDAIPNCSNARGNKTLLWPPNGTFARVKIRGLDADRKISAHDTSGDDGEGNSDADDPNEDTGSLILRATSITQDEPTSGLFLGDVAPDAIIQSVRPNGLIRQRDLILLKRERNPTGDGRVYVITFSATNTLSNASCSGQIKVCVPIAKKGKTASCVDSGQNYNSLQ